MDFACNSPFTAYTNAGPGPKSVSVTITDNCGGNAQVYVVTPSGDVIDRTQVNAPGGVVSFSIAPANEIHVFCDGGSDTQNDCQVDLSFP